MSEPKALSGANRREFFRVQRDLPVRHRVLTATQAEAFSAQFSASAPAAATPMEKMLERLLAVEEKLEKILAHLDVDSEPPLSVDDTKALSISASGLSYVCTDEIEAGTPLLVEFRLPEVPPRQIRCVSEVVHCIPDKESGRRRIALRYVSIRQEDQDAIVRYALHVEREQRREERQAEDQE